MNLLTKLIASIILLFVISSCADDEPRLVASHGVPTTPEVVVEEVIEEPTPEPTPTPIEETRIFDTTSYALYIFPEVDWLAVEKEVMQLDYFWLENSPRVKLLQQYIGVTADGVYGLGTWGAHRTHAVDLDLINLSYPTPPTSSIIKDGWECPEWMDVARSAGWPEEQLRKLSYVIYRESRCDPNAFNGADPIGGSLGLIQINRYWCTSNVYWPDGYLQVRDSGVTTCDDLYDPYVNLRSGYHIWVTEGGWSPWGL
tara:strand:+ start:102 stop:869 length:768 start_codon:yes stop_codon:yes gene_type:complete